MQSMVISDVNRGDVDSGGGGGGGGRFTGGRFSFRGAAVSTVSASNSRGVELTGLRWRGRFLVCPSS